MKKNNTFLEYKHFFQSTLSYFESAQINEVYIVGGFLRDLITFNTLCSNDIDFIVSGDTEKISYDFSNMFGGEVKVYPSFFTAKVISPSKFKSIEEIDFASMREETYKKGGAFPTTKPTNSLEVDLKRRDFTINTLAILLRDFIKIFTNENQGMYSSLLKDLCIDKFNAMQDLENKIIRVLHDKSFYDDPTRIFRAFKYKERICARFDEHTDTLIKEAIKNNVLATISKSRVQKELEKIKKENNSQKILDELKMYGISKEEYL